MSTHSPKEVHLLPLYFTILFIHSFFFLFKGDNGSSLFLSFPPFLFPIGASLNKVVSYKLFSRKKNRK